MKKSIKKVLFFLFAISLINTSYALLNIELTKWANNAIPIAIVPFTGQAAVAQNTDNLALVINNDLQNSGRFKALAQNKMTQSPGNPASIDIRYWRGLAVDYMLVGQVNKVAGNQYQVNTSLVGVFPTKDEKNSQSVIFSQSYTVTQPQLRELAHHISDLIYQRLVGKRGIFSTRLAYVVVERHSKQPTKYILEVSDVDGFNPQSLLTSPQPIMSPAWSPDAKQIAYVSFEKGVSQIYVQTIADGQRRLLTSFSGINGAPAWSPDGKKLAVVLSKSGSPKIYSIDVSNGQLTQLTNGYSIDTEPSWSPNGQSIVFTSDRGGGPQIYRLDLSGGQVQRVTFAGNYNARATYTPDGNSIVMMHRDEDGNFDIAEQSLQNGTIKLLTRARLDESPSLAPNGEMVLYASDEGDRIQLGIVSTDGRVKLQLPTRLGDVQAPAWSPFLS